MAEPKRKSRARHTKTGNCSHPSVLWRGDELQDACPDHDEPRGECSECPRCEPCDDARTPAHARRRS